MSQGKVGCMDIDINAEVAERIMGGRFTAQSVHIGTPNSQIVVF